VHKYTFTLEILYKTAKNIGMQRSLLCFYPNQLQFECRGDRLEGHVQRTAAPAIITSLVTRYWCGGGLLTWRLRGDDGNATGGTEIGDIALRMVILPASLRRIYSDETTRSCWQTMFSLVRKVRWFSGYWLLR
jgi:hypothetical protein